MNILNDLLNMDVVARTHGCGLHPRLRQAIDADLRWPVKAASPRAAVATSMGENVVTLGRLCADHSEKSA
ncbi:MAG: hypothetical protein AAFO77_02440 [Pseudomonadota bacterium]